MGQTMLPAKTTPTESRRYVVEPTAQRFHACPASVRGLMGPIGGGKSVTCVNEILRRIVHQKKGPDGKRRSRWAIIRQTYPELRTTTLNTWKDWVDPRWCKYRMDSPIFCNVKIGDIDAEVYFLAIERPDDAKKLLSLELTGAWINEARELDYSIVRAVRSRIGAEGRYPSKANGGTSWAGLLMDTNPPDTDHWWYKKFEVEQPEGWKLFKQPPALIRRESGLYVPNPRAENIENLNGGHAYYTSQIPGNDDEWIKVYILGEYGSVMDGKPVYSEYRDNIHCASEPLELMRGLPLYIGYDYGRTPAAVFLQKSPHGQLRWIDELAVETDGDGMGIRTFMRDVVMPHVQNHYSGLSIIARGDPSGVAKDGNDLSCFDIQGEEGMTVEAASSNNPVTRTDAIRKYLKSMVDGDPGFLISPKCQIGRKGFLGGYKYRRVKVAGEERYKDEPDKNRYSHTHDAGQYGALAVEEGNHIVRVQAKPVQRINIRGWV